MKLMVSDLDGTLYPKNGDRRQLVRNIKAIKEWVNRGNKFAVATARGEHHYVELKKTIGMEVNFIGANGSSIVFEDGQKIVKDFACQIYIDLCHYLKANNINATAAIGYEGEWLWSSKSNFPIGSSIFSSETEKDIKTVDLSVLDPEYPLQMIQVFVAQKELHNLRKMIEKLALPVTITRSDDYLLNLCPPDSSKGIAIEMIMDKYSIDKENLITVGDSENDIPMFTIAKRSYCIDHAESVVLCQATFPARSLEAAIRKEMQYDEN